MALNKREEGERTGAGAEVFQPTNDMWQQLKQRQQSQAEYNSPNTLCKRSFVQR